MGKRELVLISLFVAIGIVVYQFTAPPPPPGSEGLSVGGIVQKLRRGIQGARESANAETHQTAPIDASTQQIRINLPRSNDLTITGSDRTDVSIEMRTTARGFDQAEARALADAQKIQLEQAGDALVVSGTWPDRRGGSHGYVYQTAITIDMPRRLAVRIEPHLGKLTVSDVASFEGMGSRGETRLQRIAGHVLLGHTGGTLEIDGCASLKLTARNGRGEIKHVNGAVTIEVTGGELKLSDIAGPLEIESRNGDLTLESLRALKPPFRYNGTGGELRVTGLRTEARIDGRNTDMEIALDAAAPVTIYNVGDIVATAPPGGYALDAVATEGHISVEEPGVTPSDGPDSRASGKIRGGGPMLTLRATRGRIDVRKPSAK